MCVSGCASTRPGIDSNAARVPVLTITIGSAEAANRSTSNSDFQSFRAYEASRPKNEFRACLLVVVKIDIVQIRYHAAFSGEDCWHVNAEAVREHAELLASTKIRRYPGTLKNVLTRQTGDVGARSAYVLALNHRNTLPLTGKRPCGNRRSCAAAEDYHVVGLGLKKLFRSR
jgi:hypothetical protein